VDPPARFDSGQHERFGCRAFHFGSFKPLSDSATHGTRRIVASGCPGWGSFSGGIVFLPGSVDLGLSIDFTFADTIATFSLTPAGYVS
jgi:hypothetical protein